MLGEKLLASVDWATKGRRRIEEVRRKSRNAHQNTENFSPYWSKQWWDWLPPADRVLKIYFPIICTIHQVKPTCIRWRKREQNLASLGILPISPHALPNCQPLAYNHWNLPFFLFALFSHSFLSSFHKIPGIRIKILYPTKGRDHLFETPSPKTVYIEEKCHSAYSESTETFQPKPKKSSSIDFESRLYSLEPVVSHSCYSGKVASLFRLQTNISKPTKTLQH